MADAPGPRRARPTCSRGRRHAYLDDPRRLVAAQRGRVISSRDGGRSCNAAAGLAIVLAWPRGDALYALGPDGATGLSRDGGVLLDRRRLRPRRARAAITAVDDETLVVALHDGGFAHSSDGGRSWASGAWPELCSGREEARCSRCSADTGLGYPLGESVRLLRDGGDSGHDGVGAG